MKRIIAVLVCILLAVPVLTAKNKKKDSAPLSFQFDSNYRALDARYREWLDMVAYISSPDEISTFLGLPTVRDREMFIRLFWQQRDPTLGTEANQYRDEIESRFRHVNQYFGRGTSRPGWMTDMGHVYMILGEPKSIETLENEMEIKPTQVWYYNGDQKLGLPIYFNIVFFKPQGTGEWKLYDPNADGPASLLATNDQVDTYNYRQIYQILKQKAPTLLGPAFSMIPGQSLVYYTPSTGNSLILANIYRSPIKAINADYATSFLKYKSYVNVDTSINYIENTHTLNVFKDDRWGYNLIVFSVKPKKLTIDYEGGSGQYSLGFDLIIALKRGNQEIYSYRRHQECSFASGQLDILKSGGIVIHDGFPAVPGDYQLAVFMQNPISKEFAFFEDNVHIPDTAEPRLAVPVIGFKAEKLTNDSFCMYQTDSQRLSVDPDRIFIATDAPLFWLGAYNIDKVLWEKGFIEWQISGLNKNPLYTAKSQQRLIELPLQRNINIIKTISADTLRPDSYRMTVKLINGDGRILDSREADFQVSPLPSLAKPSEIYNQASFKNPYFFDFVIGQQFRNLGDDEKAAFYYEKSLLTNPDFSQARQALLEIWLAQGRFARVLPETEKLPRDGQTAFAYHYLRGEALSGLAEYQAALNELLEANKIINTDVKLINHIGQLFLKTGDPGQAAKAFTASLALNGDQPQIKRLLDAITKAAAPQKEQP